MKKEDLEYLKETLEYALNDCPVKDGDHSTHFNTFANALELIKDELNLFNISGVGVTLPKTEAEKFNDWIKDVSTKTGHETYIYKNKEYTVWEMIKKYHKVLKDQGN